MISFNSKGVNTVYLNNANNLLNSHDMLPVDSDGVVIKILLCLGKNKLRASSLYSSSIDKPAGVLVCCWEKLASYCYSFSFAVSVSDNKSTELLSKWPLNTSQMHPNSVEYMPKSLVCSVIMTWIQFQCLTLQRRIPLIWLPCRTSI